MTAHRQRGYSLMEIVVAMTIFLIFLATLFALTADMRNYEKRLPINFQRHPQLSAVVTRLRRDVMDGLGSNPYRNNDPKNEFTAGEKVLILETLTASGGAQTIVWDFREPGIVRRRAYNGPMASDWWARGLPAGEFTIGAVKTGPRAAWATHIQMKDKEGRLAIDQILQPRAIE